MSSTSLSALSSTSSVALGVRKRVDSSTDDPFSSASSKRPRVSAMAGGFRRGGSISIGEGEDRMIRPLHRSGEGDISLSLSSPRRQRFSISSGSFAPVSRAQSPLLITDLHGSPPSSLAGRAIVRSASSSSLGSCAPLPQTYPEVSAKHHLRPSKVSIDYGCSSPSDPVSARLLSCSADNILFFTRGNRVHFKNLNSSVSEDVTQLCRLSGSRGNIRAIECGGKTLPGVVAIGLSQGYIQTWDIRTRKMLMSWPTTKDISALAWNGPVLTVGGVKGTIRLYDTRVSPVEKMREQARKITRHQGQISCLSWNDDGKLLASGDSSGMIHCWEYGQMVPMNVGEFVQRRKKMQHDAGISALSWSPWSPKLLASGDAKGVLRLWNINPNDPSSNAATPGKVDTGAKITGIHFSSQCMEILTTHGDAATSGDLPPTSLSKPSMANSLSVHTASLRHVTTLKTPVNKPMGDSVLNPSGLKVICALPDEAKINIYDVWAKRKEVKRQASFTSATSLYIR